MALSGTAFLAIWHDLQPGVEQAFETYHTVEHMPERLGIPGFLRGRRYMNWQLKPHVCFTMYEATHLEVFRSPGYVARLNAPTPWTQKIQPLMCNFLRGGCETFFSRGAGIAGAMAVLRVSAAEAGPASESALMKVALDAGTGVTGMSLARHRPEITNAPTGETALRPASASKTFDYLMLIEALDMNYLAALAPVITAQLAEVGCSVDSFDPYSLSFVLDAPKV